MHTARNTAQFQMTSYYTANFRPLESIRDTLPVFLGGNYTSKVEAESKVAQYIRGAKAVEHRGNDVSQYYANKAELNKSIDQKSQGRKFEPDRSDPCRKSKIRTSQAWFQSKSPKLPSIEVHRAQASFIDHSNPLKAGW